MSHDDVEDYVEEFEFESSSPSPSEDIARHASSSAFSSSPFERSQLREESMPCEYCLRRFSSRDLASHVSSCELRMESCPHGQLE